MTTEFQRYEIKQSHKSSTKKRKDKKYPPKTKQKANRQKILSDLDSRKNKGDAFIMISHFRISSFDTLRKSSFSVLLHRERKQKLTNLFLFKKLKLRLSTIFWFHLSLSRLTIVSNYSIDVVINVFCHSVYFKQFPRLFQSSYSNLLPKHRVFDIKLRFSVDLLTEIFTFLLNTR